MNKDTCAKFSFVRLQNLFDHQNIFLLLIFLLFKIIIHILHTRTQNCLCSISVGQMYFVFR